VSSIIREQATNSSGNAALTIANGFTNQGTIELTSGVSGFQQTTFTVTAGTLVNAPGATITPLVGGSNGARILAAQLDNQGTLTIANPAGMTLSKSGAQHTNSGTITLAGGNLAL